MSTAPISHPALRATHAWLHHAVLGLRLCPFAKAPAATGRIGYRVCESDDPRDLLDELRRQMGALARTDPAELETLLLVHPNTLLDFDDYNDFLEVAEAALEDLGLDGVLQIASFHPHYRFAGTAADDITNATNRSPHPTLQLLREASVERAVATLDDPVSVWQANVATFEALGEAGWAALQARIEADAAGPAAAAHPTNSARTSVIGRTGSVG